MKKRGEKERGWRRKRETRKRFIAGTTKDKGRDGHGGRTMVVFRCDDFL